MRTNVGVWPRVMKRENMGLCNGRRREQCTSSVMAESKRERSKEASGGERERERERENGEKRRNIGLVTVINWDPYEFNPDLNPAWIQKQAKWCSQIWHETHIKFKLGFQFSLKNSIPNIFFLVGPNDYGFESLNHDLSYAYQTPT
jgi:hypothetical protein